MVELYVDNLRKSIEELELAKESGKYMNHHLGRMLVDIKMEKMDCQAK